MLIDTHAHLYASEFDDDRKEVLEKALEKGVKKILLPNIDSHSIEGMMQMEVDFPNICYPMMGLHPCSVKENYREELSLMRRWIDKRDFIAIGEIGIDLYWDKTFVKEQEEAFLEQTRWALEKGWPIVIHSRESIDMILDLLEPLKSPALRGVFHCFSGNSEQAKRIMDLGFYMGLGGVLTFKNSGLDKVVRELPLSSLILETDAPYLAPTPFRGKRNESAYVALVAEKLAEVKEISIDEIERITTENAKNLFIC
ncbi:MAG: TatD family hydrolase [Saprospiraceae bacterium]|nr:TatD family hydrolase [Saprospiraceae bacterium]